MKRSSIIHLYNRIGFGISESDMSEWIAMDQDAVVDYAFAKAASFNFIDLDLSKFDELKNASSRKLMSKDTVRELRREAAKMTRQLNTAWIYQMSTTEAVLREKMTLFWSNVFVCRNNPIWYSQSYHNMLREHALGNLRDFLKAMATAPAMLVYLNNNRNVKSQPNENFARELLELFTLGEGNYTESDVKEAARAFTGWSTDKNGAFKNRVFQHDKGEKTFLGKTGNWDGNDIINIILEQKECARFICAKIYTYFVNPIIDNAHLELMTELFYEDYDIQQLMELVFKSDWFYDEKNISAKIKSPVELLIGIMRQVPVTFNKPRQLFYLQKMMGQVLLYPPNVAGWKGDRAWIDANTLLFRLNLASALLNNAFIEYREDAAFEDSFEDFYKAKKKRKTRLQLEVKWDEFLTEISTADRKSLQQLLLGFKIDPDTQSFIQRLNSSSDKEFVVQLMSLPEYQMC